MSPLRWKIATLAPGELRNVAILVADELEGIDRALDRFSKGGLAAASDATVAILKAEVKRLQDENRRALQTAEVPSDATVDTNLAVLRADVKRLQDENRRLRVVLARIRDEAASS